MGKIDIKIKLDSGAKLPDKSGDPTDAGYDVYATSDPEIVGEQVLDMYATTPDLRVWYNIDYIQYRTGIYIEPVDKSKAIQIDIRPRSSISKYWLSLCNPPGTIDHTYGGEILVRFRPVIQPSMLLTHKGDLCMMLNCEKLYKRGDKICQIMPDYVKEIEWKVVNEIQNTRKGFGSTGA